jgi:two-component system sensor histidine kinase RstB
VENAAKAVAAGDLSARVDERRVRAAKTLAQAFNNMADRTETLVRTQRELLQAVSHELRTPLSRMRFAIDLVESAKDDEERRKRLESLDAATGELDRLVGELLSYVRMETAPASLDRETVHIVEAVDEWIEKQDGLFPTVSFAIDDETRRSEPVIQADRTALERAVGNLLANAGRFARGRVIVRSHVSPQGLVLDVDDDGPGIPVGDRPRVFEPFVRLDESGRGAGLGLALVRRIVQNHGGEVSILDSPLGGCRVRTVWPHRVAASDPQAADR